MVLAETRYDDDVYERICRDERARLGRDLTPREDLAAQWVAADFTQRRAQFVRAVCREAIGLPRSA